MIVIAHEIMIQPRTPVLAVAQVNIKYHHSQQYHLAIPLTSQLFVLQLWCNALRWTKNKNLNNNNKNKNTHFFRLIIISLFVIKIIRVLVVEEEAQTGIESHLKSWRWMLQQQLLPLWRLPSNEFTFDKGENSESH